MIEALKQFLLFQIFLIKKVIASVLRSVTIKFRKNKSNSSPCLSIEKLIWDSWNVEHIKKHGILKEDVELAMLDPNLLALESYAERLIILAKSDKRLITTVLAKKENGNFYVVTARNMSIKERRIYKSKLSK